MNTQTRPTFHVNATTGDDAVIQSMQRVLSVTRESWDVKDVPTATKRKLKIRSSNRPAHRFYTWSSAGDTRRYA